MNYLDLDFCVDNILGKLDSFGIRKLFSIDWLAIINIEKDKKISIKEELNYTNIDSFTIIQMVTGKSEELLLSQQGKIYNNLQNNYIHTIMSPICSHNYDKLFLIISNIHQEYTKKDLCLTEFIAKGVCENMLLNSKFIYENKYFCNIFNSTDIAILSINLQGIITTANRASFDVYGLPPEDMVGKEYYLFLTEYERTSVSEKLNYVIENNKTYCDNNKIFSKNIFGQKYVDLVYCPLNDNKNQVVGIVLIAKDITKLTIYEKELEQLKQFAALGEMASGIAHDIRNPLMSIRGCANILKKHLHKEPKYMEFLEPIILEVDRINEVVEQMLSYVTITKKNNYTLVSISEVLDKCLNVIHFYKNSKYITINKNIPEDLPLIRGNNVQLQQAFINILINAIQSIENEGIINITSHYLKKEKKILISISDNGTGISAEEMDNIFIPFYTTRPDGTGLGLSIVKNAINKCDGEIKITSELNKGTIVEVYIPVRKE